MRTVYVRDGEDAEDSDSGFEEPPQPEDGGSGDSSGTVVTAALLSAASPEELARYLADRNARIDPGAVATLIAQLDDARLQRDWNRFRTLLSLLGKAGTPESQAKLVAVMGDPDLGFHQTRLGRRFFDWLAGSNVPGIAAAARARIQRELADNPSSTSVQRGWLALIALHGGLSDLDWIQNQANTRAGRREAIEAFVSAGARPDVAERVAAMFRNRERRWFRSHLSTFAQANPAAAMTLMEEALRAPKKGEEHDLARIYGEATRPDQIEQARSFLLSLPPESQTLGGVYAVQAMQRRGLDVSGMDAITQAPVLALEGYSANPKSIDLYQARRAIERNSVTWSERAAKALENAAATAPKNQVTGLLEAAKRIRANIGSPDSEWVTSGTR